MTALQYILAIVIILLSVGITVLVMLQESKQEGLSGAIAGAADNFFGKNKGRTIEARLAKITRYLAIVFFVLAFAATLLMLFF